MRPPDTESLRAGFPALVRELEGDDVDALAGALDVHEAGAGEALVVEGTESDELFAVESGRLDIVVERGDGDQHVAAVGPGSYFGEVSLFDPGPSGATIVTDEGCRVLRLTRARFDELCATHPSAAASLQREALRSLSMRLRDASAYLGAGGAT